LPWLNLGFLGALCAITAEVYESVRAARA